MASKIQGSPQILTKTKLISLVIGGLLLAGLLATLINNGEISVELTSGDLFLVDNNKGCTVEPNAAYVAFEVCNNGLETKYSLQAELKDFSNPQFGLAGGQPAIQTIDTLAMGECITLYWYTYYDCSDADITTDASIYISDTKGNQISFLESFITVSTIDAGAGGKILSSYLFADTVIGSILEYDCEYAMGALKEGTQLTFQPAGNLDFSADCFQLVGSEITYSEIPNIQLGDRDRLFYSNSGRVSGSNNVFRVKYFFRNNCVSADTSNLRSYSSAVSGTSFKRYNLGQDEINNDPFLPIEWHWMKLEWQEQTVAIQWEADGVQASEQYQIERSVDGKAFQPISQVEALSLEIAPSIYQFEDTRALEFRSNLIYYRIKHTDIDGLIKYSEVKSIHKIDTELALSFYPNPAREVLNVRYQNLPQKAGYISIFNLAGQNFFKRQFSQNEDFDQQISLSNLPEGEYFLEVICGDQRSVKPFIKL